ncbi:MAG TPA: hypothetical protein VM030_10690 [Acidimicrobiales bacterium]|nr:hypothetical protein [Acidimicrobiales bacterium]
MTGTAVSDRLYADVVGQERAVAQLRASAAAPCHAYLLVGPAGSGKRAAALSFAAALLCRDGGCGACRDCVRVLSGSHPDVVLVQRVGASIQMGEAQQVARMATRSPVEGYRKVLVLDEFHLVDQAGPALLKTIEEPPATTFFVVLADHVPSELVTIASRCARIEFSPIASEVIVATLVADGTAPDVAAQVVVAAGGNLERARLLASDPGVAARMEAWRSVPERLDGTGSSVTRIADELLALVTQVEAALLKERHEAEAAALEERARQFGERGQGRKDLEARQKRECRRLRVDELRLGLATLAASYRPRLTGEPVAARQAVRATRAIAAAAESLIRNPSELLLMQGLLTRLSHPDL